MHKRSVIFKKKIDSTYDTFASPVLSTYFYKSSITHCVHVLDRLRDRRIQVNGEVNNLKCTNITKGIIIFSRMNFMKWVSEPLWD